MTNHDLAHDYIRRCALRVKSIELYVAGGGYADAVRGCQETVALLLKALLRRANIDPPHWHDVSSILEANQDRLPPEAVAGLPRMTQLSKQLKKEREIAFYGDDDFIPSESYTKDVADRFLEETTWLLGVCQSIDRRR